MTVVRSTANPATVLFSFSSFAMRASPIKLVPVPVREAKPALERQQYGETLAAVAARKPGKLPGMRAARFFPIPAPSLARDGWRRAAVVFTGFALVLLVAVVDSFLGGAYRLGLLYLVPIALRELDVRPPRGAHGHGARTGMLVQRARGCPRDRPGGGPPVRAGNADRAPARGV